MATHLRYLKDDSRGLDVLSIIVGVVALFVMSGGLILYCRRCLRPYVEEATEREQQRRGSQSEPSQIMTADLQAFRAHRQQRPHSTLVGLSPVRETAHEDRSALVKRCLYSHKLQKGENARNLSEALGGNPTKTKSISSSRSSSSSGWWIGLESSVRSVKQSVRSVKESVRSVISTSKPECSICLQLYEEGETISWAKNEDCNHMYHEECIVEWLSNHDECPLCRTNLLEGGHHTSRARFVHVGMFDAVASFDT